MFGRNVNFHAAVICHRFVLIGLAWHIALFTQHLHLTSIHVIITCLRCLPLPKKKTLNKDNLLILVVLEFNSCFSNVQTDLNCIFLILRIRICCMINIEVCFLLDILRIAKQVGIRSFSQYFVLFLFSFFQSFLPVLFTKFQCSIYCFSQLLKHMISVSFAWKRKKKYIWKFTS